MKLICLIRPRPHTIYFVNAIHKKFPVSLVVIESDKPQSAGERIAEQGLFHAMIEHLKFRARRFTQSSAHKESVTNLKSVHDRLFEGLQHKLNPDIPVLRVTSINNPSVAERLKKESPDVLLDHGTSIVHDDVLATAPLTLNLHWGLSPYYRGSICTKAALLRKDPLNIGVTVHKLARDVDGGDILAQARANVTASDTPETIDAQLTKLGTDITIRAIGALHEGKKLKFHKQNLTEGIVIRSKEWTPEKEKEVRTLTTPEGMQDMLNHPLRPEQPIILWGQ